MKKYRLICGPDSDLVKKTVELAKDKSLQAALSVKPELVIAVVHIRIGFCLKKSINRITLPVHCNAVFIMTLQLKNGLPL